MLRLVGVTIPDDVDVFNGLRMIKGLDTKNSHAKIENILTKAGLYTYKMKDTRVDGKVVSKKRAFEKVYPKVANLSWKEKARLIDLLEMPRAVLRNIHTSPKKLRLVADAIRGKKTDEALAMLTFMEKGGAPIFLKLLESAIKNAQNNHGLNTDDLYIAKVTVDGGATMKRFMPRARGRAARIKCRTSHAKIVLREAFSMAKFAPVAKTAETAAPAKKSVKKAVKSSEAKAPKATKTTKKSTKVQGGNE